VLSPVKLNLDPKEFTANSGTDLQDDSYRSRVILSDGGVYDNLGLETAWKRYKTILVSDAGASFGAKAKLPGDWVRHTLRVLFTIDNQVRSLRKRQVMASFGSSIREGAYWSIGQNQSVAHPIETNLRCDFGRTTELACIGTRLKRLPAETQRRLINWGYAVCDSAIRKHYDSSLTPAKGFPYPDISM
jgi:NTE family protein